MLAVLGWTADRRVRHAVLAAAEERLTGAADQLSALLSGSARQIVAGHRALAADPRLAAALAAPTEQAIAEAHEALMAALPRGNPSAPVLTLWSVDCVRMVTTSPLPVRGIAGRCPERARQPAAAAIGAFVQEGDELRYTVSGAVRGPDSAVIGLLVQTRSYAQGQNAGRIAGLIGREVEVRLGNRDGTGWSDLVHPVDGPPSSTPRDRIVTYTDARGEVQLGVARDVAGTPWTAWVQMPESAAVAPARRLLWEILATALACVLAGALGAWLVGRHVAAPIDELTRAAGELARGNYSQRVDEARHDELGVLAHAFNTMAARVEAASDELHEQFQEASDLATELELANQELLESMNEARTARRETEEARSLFDDVLATAPVGIAVYDRGLRYREANAAFVTMAELGPGDVAGRAPEPGAPRLDSELLPLLEQVLREESPLLNQRVVTREGTRDRACCTASVFPVRGPDREVAGVGCVVVDTTAQDDLELRLLQSQKMEAVGRLAGGVAHDFNNLLTVITSYAALAVESLPRDAALRDDLQEIRGAADRATALTRQLLAFSRKQLMQPRVVRLNDLARDMERMLQRLIGEDVVLSLDLAPALGNVFADPGQLEQVLLNLVVNARDAMPDGGRLVIQTANVTLSRELSIGALGATAGEYVTLTVADTGRGMSPETQQHLFEPFFTTKPAGRGTGLGLATVYGVVKQSDGDIHVDSAPGQGTRVRIYLPRCHDECPAVIAPPATVALPRGTETILLLEDDDALRVLASRILTRAGYTVLETGSPDEALARCESYAGPVELLLTDVVMPGLNGREVAERIQASRPGIRVLYMSGYTDDEVTRRGIVAAGTRFLPKPFSGEQLVQAVRDALDNGRPAAGIPS